MWLIKFLNMFFCEFFSKKGFRIVQIFFKFFQMFLKIHSKLLSFRKYFSKLKYLLLPFFALHGRNSGYALNAETC